MESLSRKGFRSILPIPAACPTLALNSVRPELYLPSLPEPHCTVVSSPPSLSQQPPLVLWAAAASTFLSQDLSSIHFVSPVDGLRVSCLKVFLPVLHHCGFILICTPLQYWL